MIAAIEGIVSAKGGNRLIIEVSGVGFEVFVPLRALEAIGGKGEKVRLHTYMYVRDDAMVLYGFLDEKERSLFQALLGVSGVGPKVALAILSFSDAGEIARLIHERKTGILTSFPGIGKKTAERIVLELRDKIELAYYAGEERVPVFADRDLLKEAAAVLESLGLSRAKAESALGKVSIDELGEGVKVEEIVREALKKVGAKA